MFAPLLYILFSSCFISADFLRCNNYMNLKNYISIQVIKLLMCDEKYRP